MIIYDPGQPTVLLVCRLKGSVFPRALPWAISGALLAFCIRFFFAETLNEEVGTVSIGQIWSNYNFVLGFLLVFRTTQAYNRFWQGATNLQQVRGEWMNMTSSLIAFCSRSPEKSKQVYEFQHKLVRMISLLYCSALQDVAVSTCENYDVIDITGMNEEDAMYLSANNELKVDIIVQWTQQVIIESVRQQVLDAAPPIVTRTFQELSRGVVKLKETREITEIPFPFPYAQMVALMLLLTVVVTPALSALCINSAPLAGIMAGLSVFLMWCVNLIAQELECPFGDDANDVQINGLSQQMNVGLLMLLDSQAQRCPFWEAPDLSSPVCVQSCPKVLRFDEEQSQKTKFDIITERQARRSVHASRATTAARERFGTDFTIRTIPSTTPSSIWAEEEPALPSMSQTMSQRTPSSPSAAEDVFNESNCIRRELSVQERMKANRSPSSLPKVSKTQSIPSKRNVGRTSFPREVIGTQSQRGNGVNADSPRENYQISKQSNASDEPLKMTVGKESAAESKAVFNGKGETAAALLNGHAAVPPLTPPASRSTNAPSPRSPRSPRERSPEGRPPTGAETPSSLPSPPSPVQQLEKRLSSFELLN
eukprot:TRINITY_DN7304_c0_g1_i1.p1 TRINITY_DN7304_c0_g1~~TRINITY_DN7304_c0_g1_i1.p1  ORF type:complete len:595 (+),score=120.07 TRINITY_DN7304_c0_g1_i1:65-1849(+)